MKNEILVSKAVENYLKENFEIVHKFPKDSETSLSIDHGYDVTGDMGNWRHIEKLTSLDEIIKLNFDEQGFVCKLLDFNTASSLEIGRNKPNELLSKINAALEAFRNRVRNEEVIFQEKIAKIIYENSNDWNLNNSKLLDYNPDGEKEKISSLVAHAKSSGEVIDLIKSSIELKLEETERLNETLKTKISTEKSIEILEKQIKEYTRLKNIYGGIIGGIIIAMIGLILILLLDVSPEILDKFFELTISHVFIFTTIITLISFLLNFFVKNYNNTMSMLENKKEKLSSMQVFLALSASDVELGTDLEQARKKMIEDILTIKSNNWDKYGEVKFSKEVLPPLKK